MRATRTATVLILASSLSLVLAACSGSKAGGGASGGASKSSGTLIFGEGSDFPDNFLGVIAAGNVTSVADLGDRVLTGAFRMAPDISYQLDTDQATAATSSIVDGQQVVDIKINPKAVWADGQPITADDYIFTWQELRSTDPAKGGCASLLGEVGFDQIESGVAASSKEVKFTFIKDEPFADWRGLFGGEAASTPLLAKHVMDKGSPTANCAAITAGWPVADGIPLGEQNGPWLIEKQNVNVANKTITLVPNPKYWGQRPKLARIVYTNIGSDSDTNVKALQNGEVNMIYPQPQLDLVANLKKLGNVTTSINFGPSFEHLDFNTRDPLLARKEVREAIAYAIDRPALVAATVGKFSDKASVLGNRILVSNQTGYVNNSGSYAKPDVAKAAALLQGIGATKGSDGIWSVEGKKLNFVVSTTQNNPLRDTTIQLIKQQLAPFGIGITENADADLFKDKTHPQSLEAGGFQIALFAWVAGPSVSAVNSIYQSLDAQGGAQGQNYTHGADPQVDTALTQLAQAATPEIEAADANKADQLLWGDMFSLPLYQKPTLLAYGSNYTGISDNGTQAGPLWNNDGFGEK